MAYLETLSAAETLAGIAALGILALGFWYGIRFIFEGGGTYKRP